MRQVVGSAQMIPPYFDRCPRVISIEVRIILPRSLRLGILLMVVGQHPQSPIPEIFTAEQLERVVPAVGLSVNKL